MMRQRENFRTAARYVFPRFALLVAILVALALYTCKGNAAVAHPSTLCNQVMVTTRATAEGRLSGVPREVAMAGTVFAGGPDSKRLARTVVELVYDINDDQGVGPRKLALIARDMCLAQEEK